MRYLFVLLMAMSFLWSATPQARTVQELANKMKDPIVLKSTSSPRLNVTFNHSSHANVACQTCHHKIGSDQTRYRPCTECHNVFGPHKTDKKSSFMAFHNKESKHSCLGCHSSLAKSDPSAYPNFKNCRPCHTKAPEKAAAK